MRLAAIVVVAWSRSVYYRDLYAGLPEHIESLSFLFRSSLPHFMSSRHAAKPAGADAGSPLRPSATGAVFTERVMGDCRGPATASRRSPSGCPRGRGTVQGRTGDTTGVVQPLRAAGCLRCRTRPGPLRLLWGGHPREGACPGRDARGLHLPRLRAVGGVAPPTPALAPEAYPAARRTAANSSTEGTPARPGLEREGVAAGPIRPEARSRRSEGDGKAFDAVDEREPAPVELFLRDGESEIREAAEQRRQHDP